MKNIEDLAARLIDLCRERQFVQAYKELFAQDAVSIDPVYKNEPLKGLGNLIEREEQFLAGIKLHEVSVSAPIFAGKYFSLVFSLSFTPAGGSCQSVEEIAIYQIEDNKIVSQQFFI
jgi:hypothetical protein